MSQSKPLRRFQLLRQRKTSHGGRRLKNSLLLFRRLLFRWLLLQWLLLQWLLLLWLLLLLQPLLLSRKLRRLPKRPSRQSKWQLHRIWHRPLWRRLKKY